MCLPEEHIEEIQQNVVKDNVGKDTVVDHANLSDSSIEVASDVILHDLELVELAFEFPNEPTQQITWVVENNIVDYDTDVMCLSGIPSCHLKFEMTNTEKLA